MFRPLGHLQVGFWIFLEEKYLEQHIVITYQWPW
jgi:hypothetical protein